MCQRCKYLVGRVVCEDYGVWCPHGFHVILMVGVDIDNFPITALANPWPCGECTVDDLDMWGRQDVEEYWDAMNDLMRTQYE